VPCERLEAGELARGVGGEDGEGDGANGFGGVLDMMAYLYVVIDTPGSRYLCAV
jgi:hypothetical protein